MNNRQKKILYKNMGILIILTIICAVMIRSGILSGGETLEDLAREQEETISSEQNNASGLSESSDREQAQTSQASSQTDTDSSLPAQSKDHTAEVEDLPADSAEDNSANPENKSTLPKEDTAMDDRITCQEGFYYESLNDTIKEKITGISYPADDANAAISYDMLRYVSVLYYDFDGNTRTGELICHKAIAQDLTEIFCALYEAQYPVEKICLVEEYQGDDELSMEDNNTSCFNYRALPSGRLSNHAYGLAIDLNPFYNPYVTTRKDGTVNISPAGSEAYADREQDFPYKIDKTDLAYQLFIQHGFTWGGSWRSSKDYQHFEKKI